MAGATTTGANIPLGGNFAKVLADLERVIFKAAEARGALAGLPPPGGKGSTSPRLPAMPGARVGGGKADELKSRLQFKGNPEATHAAGLGAKSAVVNGAAQSAVQAAAQRGGTGPTRPRTLKHAGAVDAAADIAESKVTGRIARKLTEFQIQRGGVDLGPLQLNAQGIGLGATFAKLLGPIAGATMAAYGGLKAINELWEFESSVVAEAAKAGRDPQAVMLEKSWGALRKGGEAVHAGTNVVLGLLAGAELEFFRQVGGGGTIPAWMPIGAPSWVAKKSSSALGFAWDEDKAQQTARGYKEYIETRMAKVRGQSTPAQKRDIAQRTGLIAFGTMEMETELIVEENAKKVAEQMLGLGFPGTRAELQEFADKRDRNEIFAKARAEFAEHRASSGVQDAGE